MSEFIRLPATTVWYENKFYAFYRKMFYGLLVAHVVFFLILLSMGLIIYFIVMAFPAIVLFFLFITYLLEPRYVAYDDDAIYYKPFKIDAGIQKIPFSEICHRRMNEDNGVITVSVKNKETQKITSYSFEIGERGHTGLEKRLPTLRKDTTEPVKQKPRAIRSRGFREVTICGKGGDTLSNYGPALIVSLITFFVFDIMMPLIIPLSISLLGVGVLLAISFLYLAVTRLHIRSMLLKMLGYLSIVILIMSPMLLNQLDAVAFVYLFLAPLLLLDTLLKFYNGSIGSCISVGKNGILYRHGSKSEKKIHWPEIYHMYTHITDVTAWGGNTILGVKYYSLILVGKNDKQLLNITTDVDLDRPKILQLFNELDNAGRIYNFKVYDYADWWRFIDEKENFKKEKITPNNTAIKERVQEQPMVNLPVYLTYENKDEKCPACKYEFTSYFLFEKGAKNTKTDCPRCHEIINLPLTKKILQKSSRL